MPKYSSNGCNPGARRQYLLGRLRKADGPSYDELCAEVVEQFPHPRRWLASTRGVRAVRNLLFEGLATTEPDESIWLTPQGWQAADDS